MNEFRAQLEECHWKDCLVAIIFDNNMSWVFNDREILWDENKHCVVFGDYIKPEDSLFFCDDGVSIKRKTFNHLVDYTDPNCINCWYWTIRNVENVQAIVATDQSNTEYRTRWDHSGL